MEDAVGKGERTRARLLDQAVRRFAADGFRRTSVADVARDAGVTPAAAYAYFTGKETLFQAAVDADAHALIVEATRLLGSVANSWARVVDTVIGLLDGHPLARRVLEGHEPEVIGRLLDLPALLDLRSQMAEELAAGQEAGTIRRDIDAKVVAAGLETLVLTLIIATLQAGEVDVERKLGVLAVLEAALLA